MFIALATVSKDHLLTRPLLDRIAAAIETQLYQHYAALWQSAGMSVRSVDATDPILKQQDCAPLIVYDASDTEGALGYHDLIANAQVAGKAFWQVIKGSGGTLIDGANSLSVTLSHEALEMVGDPYANLWADMDETTQEALELCDRVEGDFYNIDGIAVSNFLGPRAFRHGPGPYDYMGQLSSPFDLTPGGYAIRRKGDKVFNVWGRQYPEYRKDLKTSPTSRLAKRQTNLISQGDS